MENIKKFIGISLGFCLMILAGLGIYSFLLLEQIKLAVIKINKLIDNNSVGFTSTVNNFEESSKNGKELIVRVNQFATVDRLKNLENAVNTQIEATQITTNNYGAIADETVRTLRNHVQPGIDDLRKEGKETFAEVRAEVQELQKLTQEATYQVKQNGDEIKELLAGTRSLIAHSEGELIATLKEINKTSQGVQLLVNDPSLKQSIDSVAANLSNIQIITKEFADLSTHLIAPIVRPEKPKGIKKITQPLFKIFRALTAGGQILLIIERLGG